MKITKKMLLILIVASVSPQIAQPPVYAITQNHKSYDSGVVIQNNKTIGYLKYKSVNGETYNRKYDPSKVSIEKFPYYEDDEDMTMQESPFSIFNTDVNKTALNNIESGDHIYICFDDGGNISYMNGFNHYFTRYVKVKSFIGKYLVLEDQKNNLHTYIVSQNIPVTKGGLLSSMEKVKAGEWMKILVSEKVSVQGESVEEIVEIAIDSDIRKVDSIYKGSLLGIDKYKNIINLRNASQLTKAGWEKSGNIVSLSVLPQQIDAFYMSKITPLSYIEKYLKSTSMPVFVATETIMGKPRAIKMTIQNKDSRILDETTIVQASPLGVKLKSGYNLIIQEDSVLIKDNQLIESYNIERGDRIRAIVTDSNKIVVAQITSDSRSEQVNVFRGKIQKIYEGDLFELETFSSLEDGKWYFHSEAKTFKLDTEARIYSENGLSADGVDGFLGYGEDNNLGKIVTIVEINDKVTAISEMPYSKEALKGTIYQIEKDELSLKDVQYFDRNTGKWKVYSKKNEGIQLQVNPNTLIIKDAGNATVNDFEKGDYIQVMTDEKLSSLEGTELTAYIVTVEN